MVLRYTSIYKVLRLHLTFKHDITTTISFRKQSAIW